MRPVEHLPLMLVGNQMVFDAHVVNMLLGLGLNEMFLS
jgi:hypothetical protein